ncbi:MobF family relaxase [Kitasatospora sp. HPMI-4]|uniref:MobF family relaxase n=1 Tax=Kitasatospora sp. HPMI-4 TaxID=3448443 RepID=UPI003F194465
MLSIGKGTDPGYLTKEVGRGAEHYYLKAIEQAGEPAGLWMGQGAEMLGLGGTIDPHGEAVMQDLYKDFLDPRRRDAYLAELEAAGVEADSAEGRKIRKGYLLGDAPRDYKQGIPKRIETALAKEPDATPERRAEIEQKVRRETREANTYFDLTFSAPKSWSIYHASLQAAGRHEEAAQVWDAWMTGVNAGMEYMQEQAGMSRAGHHGQPVEGRASGRFVEAKTWVYSVFRQHTNRNDEPNLHVHVPVLNKVPTIDVDPVTGEERTVWRALHGQELYKHKQAGGHIAERVAEEELTRLQGVRFGMRPDGQAREILGISVEMREEFSTRSTEIRKEVGSYVKEFEETYGRTPSAYELSKISQFVTLDLRESKKHTAPTRESLLERWEAHAIAQTRESLKDVPAKVRWESLQADEVKPFDPSRVIDQAIASLQVEKSTWTRPDLIVALNKELPDCLGALGAEQVTGLLGELADAALQPGSGTGVVRTSVPHLVPIPEELTRADGTFLYESHPNGFVRYATEDNLKREDRIRQRAEAYGGRVVDRDLVDAALANGTLNTRQAAALEAIATSGRAMEVLVGPAGTGKSRLVATLTGVWEDAGGSVLGIAVGQRAANVLEEEGVEHVANLTKLLNSNKRMEAGEYVSAEERALYQLQPGHLLIVDEAGMVDTTDLDEIRRLAERAGAKVLLSGDHAQLGSVGAGGMFRQLAEDLDHVHVLDEVMRFRSDWEKTASLALRDGDRQVLLDYDAHGRLRGGSAEEMKERAYQGWLADHLGGTDSLLIAATNNQAHELAMRARADLVRAGRVQAEGVDLVRDKQVIRVGIGDEIQLRKNDRKLVGTDGRWAVNRDVATVVGLDEHGTLTVRYENGDLLSLPKQYVAGHVDLAYAGTVYAAQGRTVSTCHALVDPTANRNFLYVALTRGRDGNYGYAITEPDVQKVALDEEPPRLEMMAVFDGVLQREDREQSATMVIRAEMERAKHLAVLGPIRSDLLEEDAQRRVGQVLVDTLGVEAYRQISQEEAYGSLVRLAMHEETRGHDVEAMLTQVVQAPRGLDDADSVSEVLHWRMKHEVRQADRAAERAERIEAQALAAAEEREATAAVQTQAETVLNAVTAQQLAGAAPTEPDVWQPQAEENAQPPQVWDFTTNTWVTLDIQAPDAAAAAAAEQAALDQFMAVNLGAEVLHGWQDAEVHHRYEQQREAAAAEAASLDRLGYEQRTRRLDGPKGDYLQFLTEVMDERAVELGERAAENPPPWAIARLGEVPEDPLAREDWGRRAGLVAAYREEHGYTVEHDAIGSAPPEGAVAANSAWEAARRALGVDGEPADIARASDAELTAMVQRQEREEAWAPPYVADELKAQTMARDDYKSEALQLELRAEEDAEQKVAEHQEAVSEAVLGTMTGPELSPEDQATAQMLALQQVPHLHGGVDASELQAEMEERAETLRAMSETADERAGVLSKVHEARKAWYEHTTQTRTDAQLAARELEHRQAPEPTAAQGPEAQQPETPDTAAATAPSQPAGPVYTQEYLDQILGVAKQAQRTIEERVQQREQATAAPAVEEPSLSAEELERMRRDQLFPQIEDAAPTLERAAPAPARAEHQAPAYRPPQAEGPSMGM